MATVRMKKGDKFADIFDSPETIRQAQLDGYSVVEESKSGKAELEKEDKAQLDGEKEESKSEDGDSSSSKQRRR